MKIVLYGRAPGQEYSAPKGAVALHNYRWSQRPFFPRATESSDLLCNHIQLREEDSGSGFIRNLDSNLVFHADSEALALVRLHLSDPLGDVSREHAWLLTALKLSTQ